jgi:hypothetical protein
VIGETAGNRRDGEVEAFRNKMLVDFLHRQRGPSA